MTEQYKNRLKRLSKTTMIGGRGCIITDLNSAVQPKLLSPSNAALNIDKLYFKGESLQESLEGPHTIGTGGITLKQLTSTKKNTKGSLKLL